MYAYDKVEVLDSRDQNINKDGNRDLLVWMNGLDRLGFLFTSLLLLFLP